MELAFWASLSVFSVSPLSLSLSPLLSPLNSFSSPFLPYSCYTKTCMHKLSVSHAACIPAKAAKTGRQWRRHGRPVWLSLPPFPSGEDGGRWNGGGQAFGLFSLLSSTHTRKTFPPSFFCLFFPLPHPALLQTRTRPSSPPPPSSLTNALCCLTFWCVGMMGCWCLHTQVGGALLHLPAPFCDTFYLPCP